MLEIGGVACLHLVVVALSKDVLGGVARNGVAFLTVGIVNGEEVVAVGVVKGIPIDLGDFRVTVTPSFNLSLDFRRAMRIGHVIARKVLVVVGTRVGSFTPFQRSLTARATEEEERSVELSVFVGRPIPSELCKRLVVGACARVADDLFAVLVNGLIAPVGVIEVGADEVVSLLHHGSRAATLRGRAKHGEVNAMLVVDLLLDGEEVAVGLIEGAFGVAFARIAAACSSHHIPALTHLTRADGGHGAVVVGAVAEGIAQRDLLAVLRGACRIGCEAGESTKSGIGLAQAFDEYRVAEGVVQSAPVGEDGTSRLRIVHQDAIDHHIAVFRIVAAHTVTQRAEVVGREAVEHVARRIEQGGGIVDRGGGLLEVGIHQDHRRQVVLVQVSGVDDLGRKPRHHQQRNRQ